MRFVDGVKFGAAFYIGWTFVKTLDNVLGKRFSKNENIQKILNNMRPEKKECEPREKRIIGFHM